MKKIQILQLTHNEENHMYMFCDMDMLKMLKLSFDIKKYEVVYEYDDYEDDLDVIFAKFQGKKPEGYKGHSLSVSDIIRIDGVNHFVDSYGFVTV